MLHVRYPLSLRNVEDLPHERGIAIRHETVRFWRNRFGPLFACNIRKRRIRAGNFQLLARARPRNFREGQRRAP
jgi:transposase-like protein